ncbi:hypothetical protein D3C77_489000 [compost metagenome]
MGKTIGSQHAQVDNRITQSKTAKPGNEPFRSKGRCHANRQVSRLGPEQACCLIDHGQRTANVAAVAQARVGQRKAPGHTFKQTQIQTRLQPAYLLSNRCLGNAQLLGR